MKIPYYGIFAWLLVLLCSRHTVHSESHGFCYKDYECDEGTWGGECNIGSQQSPIDLPDPSVTYLPEYEREVLYQSAGYFRHLRYTLKNNGHSVVAAMNKDQTSTLYMSGPLLERGSYIFGQMHFHWGSSDDRGSEHTVGGHAYPMEGHLVHYHSTRYDNITDAINSKDPRALAVIGVFFELSPYDNPDLDPIVSQLAQVTEPDQEVEGSGLCLANLMYETPEAELRVMQYEGSLTTPQCSEVVYWNVMFPALPISSAQLEEFRRLSDSRGSPLVDNFRSTQSLNERSLRYTRAKIVKT